MSSSTWSCDACTTINNGARTRCEVCDTPRPRRATSTPSPPPPPIVSAPPPRVPIPLPIPTTTTTIPIINGKWQCPVCTYENPSTATSKCEICQTAKPAVTAPTPTPQPVVQTRSSPTTSSTHTAASKHRIDPSDITFLTSMGFRKETAEEALRNHHTRDAALNYLVEHPPQYAAESPPHKDVRQPIVANKMPLLDDTLPTSKPPSKSSSMPKPQASQPPPVTSATSATSATSSIPKQTTATNTPVSRAQGQHSKEATDEAARKVREQKRLALLEELKKREDELKEKEKAARLALIAEQKLKTKEEEDERKRNAFRRQKEMEEKRAEELRQREQRRNTIESQEFHSIEDAIERMRNMYELTRFVQFGKLLIKILKNILASTENENFRTLRSQNYNIQEHLVRPLSGVYILKSLGFIEQTRNINANENDMHDIDEVKKADTLYLAKDKINPTAIQHVLSLLDNSLSSYSTTVAAVFDQLTPKYSLETLSFIAKELLIILQNVVSAPTERNFCSIDCESDSYQTFLQPYPEIMDLVKSFGFEHHTSKIYWICENPNVTQCEAGIIDLQQEIFKRQKYTPVCIATTALLRENAQHKQFAITKKFVNLIDCLGAYN